MAQTAVASFAQLGLSADLLRAVDALGWKRPTALQANAIPAARRGANVVLHACPGSGVTAAFALPLLDRLASARSGAGGSESADAPTGAEASGAKPSARDPRPVAPVPHPAALVIAPTADRAAEVAHCIATLGDGSARIRALAAGWRPGDADVLAASAASLAHDLARANVKVDGVSTVVVDGLSVILGLAEPDLLDAIFVSIPDEAQRIVTTPAWSADVERFLEAHARRALVFPPRAADVALTVPPPERGGITCVEVREHDKIGVLARLLAQRDDAPRISARTPARAERVRTELTRRGLSAVVVGDDDVGIQIAFDPPVSAIDAARLVDEAIVLVRPREILHLRRVAEEAGFESGVLTEREPGGALARYREEIRRAAREHDVEAQMLILEPLFDEFTPTELAAALSALLRERRAVSPETAAPSGKGAARQRDARSEAPPGRPPSPPSFVRLFVSAGQRDGVRPADIVGSFTAEASIDGDTIGRIDVRDTFTVVEVESAVAERVIRALNGTTMRGRALRVDYDRKPSNATRRPRGAGHRSR